MSKIVKQMMIADIQAELGDCREVLVVDVSKLSGVATNKWRLGLQKKQIRVMGVKNAVARKALSDVGLTGIGDVLKGPSAIVFGGEDIVALARELTASVKELKELELKGGAVGATSLSSAQVESLSKSPGRRELLSQISGLLLERHWYVLKVQSNRERSIRDSLLRRIRQEGLEDQFGEIMIPTEKVVETKGGKKRVTEHKLYPGYLMVQMELNDETWYLVRTTSGVGDFTGSAGKPIPMLEHEIKRMLGLEQGKKEEAPLKVKVDFQSGDHVKIKDGAFESFDGRIDTIDEANGKITVLIQIFGRETPVDLEYWQVERV